MVILIITLIRPYMVWDIRMAQKLEPTSRVIANPSFEMGNTDIYGYCS